MRPYEKSYHGILTIPAPTDVLKMVSAPPNKVIYFSLSFVSGSLPATKSVTLSILSLAGNSSLLSYLLVLTTFAELVDL